MRGNILGNQVTQVYDEFFELVKVFADCKYDPLDPGDSVSPPHRLVNTGPRSGRTWGGGG